MAAVSTRDPLAGLAGLAGLAEVGLADLAGRLVPGGGAADAGSLGGGACGEIGVVGGGERPEDGDVGLASQASDLPEIFRLVELGSIVCFFPASLTRRYPRPDIVYLPVKDLAPSALAVAWPRDSRSAAVAAFVRAATEVAATEVAAAGQPG